MIVCHLDDSDSTVGPVIVLGGHVALDTTWKAFEPVADAYMSSWGVEILHTKDFHRSDGIFKGWSRNKKEEFADGLFSIASRYNILGIFASARKSDVKAIIRKNTGFQNMSPLGLCFGHIISAIMMKMHISRGDRPPLSFVVESGHKNNSNLVKYFDWLKRQGEGPRRDLSSITFAAKNDSRAIQMADFLAFYGRKSAEDLIGPITRPYGLQIRC
jgi:hypothetical protein